MGRVQNLTPDQLYGWLIAGYGPGVNDTELPADTVERYYYAYTGYHLENPEILPRLVKQSGAVSTDLQSPESAEHLCAKCQNYAQVWAVRSQQIANELHPQGNSDK